MTELTKKHAYTLVTDELGISVFKCDKCKTMRYEGDIKPELQNPDGKELFDEIMRRAVSFDKNGHTQAGALPDGGGASETPLPGK